MRPYFDPDSHRTAKALILVALVFLCAGWGWAQQQQVILHSDPISPSSIEELSGWSSLVVDAKVQSVFPATVGNEPMDMTTDVLIQIDRVLIGKSESKTVVVHQQGGYTDHLSVTSPSFDLMSPGGHYVLFLISSPDREHNFPERPGTPRYFIVGGYLGLIKMNVKSISLSAGVSPALRAKYSDYTPEAFLAKIEEIGKPGTASH